MKKIDIFNTDHAEIGALRDPFDLAFIRIWPGLH
jgi:hypothetical protein